MRISRFFHPASLKPGDTLRIEATQAHYIRTVLRLKAGAMLTVFNGVGVEAEARLIAMERDFLTLAILSVTPVDRESTLSTHLGLGISRGERMDYAIQKAVELGVDEVTPLFTERCVVQLDEYRLKQRLTHWRGVVQAACEQSGRNRLPQVHDALTLSEWASQCSGLRLFLDPQSDQRLHTLPEPQNTRITLLSGPEGGFSPAEREHALASGFTAIRLGPRILRTETAALAALSAIQTLWGDLG